MLLPEEIWKLRSLLFSCGRMKRYLARAEAANPLARHFDDAMIDLADLQVEMDRCIDNESVLDHASAVLFSIRRQIENIFTQIKTKLNSILAKNKAWFADAYVATRNGRYTVSFRTAVDRPDR